MKRLWYVILAIAIAVPAFGQLAAPGVDNSPKVGDIAPDFQIPGPQRGAPPSNLKDFQGKKKVLLMFFPGAFTPGCTTEFTEAGQSHDKFTAMNIEMLGISADLPGALAKFQRIRRGEECVRQRPQPGNLEEVRRRESKQLATLLLPGRRRRKDRLEEHQQQLDPDGQTPRRN
jgi:hypothetical protein